MSPENSLRNQMPINLSEFTNNIRPGFKADSEYRKFYYRFKFDHKTFRGVIDYSDKVWTKRDRLANAESFVLEKKKEAEQRIDADLQVNSAVAMYLSSLKEGSYKVNLQSYYDRKVKKHLGAKKVRSILPAHIQKIVDLNIESGDSPRTAKQAIEILSPAFKIARKNRVIDYNPCEDVKVVRPKTKKIVVNATERLTVVYEAIMRLYNDDPYYRAFFLLALQGRRKSEIINLKWEHISFQYDYYVLPQTKNDEEQKIFLPPNVKSALIEFYDESTEWVFESPVNKGKRLSDAKIQTQKMKRAVGDWFTMHYTRNIMVSAMAEKGVDAIYMSGALGHSDPNTITKYLTMNYLQGSKIASDMIQR